MIFLLHSEIMRELQFPRKINFSCEKKVTKFNKPVFQHFGYSQRLYLCHLLLEKIFSFLRSIMRIYNNRAIVQPQHCFSHVFPCFSSVRLHKRELNALIMSSEELACTYAALALHDAGLPVTSSAICNMAKKAGVNIDGTFWPIFFERVIKTMDELDNVIATSLPGKSIYNFFSINFSLFISLSCFQNSDSSTRYASWLIQV